MHLFALCGTCSFWYLFIKVFVTRGTFHFNVNFSTTLFSNLSPRVLQCWLYSWSQLGLGFCQNYASCEARWGHVRYIEAVGAHWATLVVRYTGPLGHTSQLFIVRQTEALGLGGHSCCEAHWVCLSTLANNVNEACWGHLAPWALIVI